MPYSDAAEAQASLLRRLRAGPPVFHATGKDKEVLDSIHKLVFAALTVAEPYYFATEICHYLAGAARTLPSCRLTHDLIPQDHGFWWFAAPFGFERPPKLGRVTLGRLGVISWCVTYGDGPNGEAVIPMQPGVVSSEAGEIRVTFWIERADSPGFHPVTTIPLSFGDPWDKPPKTLSGDPIEEIEYLDVLRLKVATFMAALLFIRQSVFTTQRERPTRDTRRREPTARETLVVYLRRVAPKERATKVGDPVAWSCRWWVKDHWRQQPCGQHGRERRPTWIAPYLKGPEDKPIHTKPRVYAVVR